MESSLGGGEETTQERRGRGKAAVGIELGNEKERRNDAY